MKNSAIWAAFGEIYCLTLEGDVVRQRHASAQLCGIGLPGFKFIEGVKADSAAVHAAFRDGKVQAFPPCFRCGLASCGSEDCNNVLIAAQVGCFLSFLRIFETALASRSRTFLVFEDDVKFHDYAPALATKAFTETLLQQRGFFSDAPCLIGLGMGTSEDDMPHFDQTFAFVPDLRQPRNPCFAFNRAFADLALSRFRKISHTADVFIHYEMARESLHYALEPPLCHELSTSTGAVPSRIHPKRIAFENAANAPEVRAAAKEAFSRHLKHVTRVPLIVLGTPRGGTGFMAHALSQFGLDVGHEALGADGISSWLFAVDDVDLPFGQPGYASNSKFVRADLTIAVVRTAPQAIFSLQIENMKNVQSYAFRRRWIRSLLDVDIDAFSTDFERALASYVFWYRIIMLRKPMAWISLERAEHDLIRLFGSGLLKQRKDPEPDALHKTINANKPYLGQVYDPINGDVAAMLGGSDSFLVKEYTQLKGELFPVFFDILR